jgi:hypothetical protein
MTTFLWLLVVVGGPLLIGLALAYGMMRSRRLSRTEERVREDAIERLYDEKDRPAATEMEPRGH